MIPCYVITLKNDFPNRKSLEGAGFRPILFKGVNAKKEEHLQYRENLSTFCDVACPIGVIGCGLSHILLAGKMYDEGLDVALVLEDDAYPKFNTLDINGIVNSVPNDWEIIKLHCDMYCNEGSHEVTARCSVSLAAYLINRKGMYKLKTSKLIYHIDTQLIFSDIKTYKSKYNMFLTDESTSDIRNVNDKHWASIFLPDVSSGEKPKSALLQCTLIRIPGTSIEITVGQVVNTFCSLLIIFILYNVVRRYSTRS